MSAYGPRVKGNSPGGSRSAWTSLPVYTGLISIPDSVSRPPLVVAIAYRMVRATRLTDDSEAASLGPISPSGGPMSQRNAVYRGVVVKSRDPKRRGRVQ